MQFPKIAKTHIQFAAIFHQNFCGTVFLSFLSRVGKEIFHFGNGRLMRGEKYLYQSVPGMAGAGKRNTEKRWEFLYEQITRSGIKVEGRLVFDIGCNSGMIVYSSLLSGALWGLGWDLPKIVESAQSLLLSLGTSRFNLFGANLKPSYSIEQDIPTNLLPHGKESIIFYLSVRQHIGVLESLKTMPWRVFVYEGHQSESLDEIPLILKPLLKNDVEITVSTFFADGDSRKRPFVILVRK